MSTVAIILEQIQPLITQLSAEERLTLIRSIAQLDMSNEAIRANFVFRSYAVHSETEFLSKTRFLLERLPTA